MKEVNEANKTHGAFTGAGHGLQPTANICTGNGRRCADSF